MISSKVQNYLRTISYDDPRLVKALHELRSWMGPKRSDRLSGYLNRDSSFWAYCAYYLPLHLPENFWIFDQLKRKNYSFDGMKILDAGCGPGTATLSYLLWCESRGNPLPGEVHLWDQSAKALNFARVNLEEAFKGVRFLAKRRRFPLFPPDKNFDIVFLGHVLNEWGAGAKHKSQKRKLIDAMLERMSPGGTLVITEPPLREPTHDLMSLRDDLARDYTIVAPCPAAAKTCPMLRASLGWCYAQVPRASARALGLAPVDKKLERILDIDLTQTGFSYLVVSKKSFIAPATEVAISDPRSPKNFTCSSSGKISLSKNSPEHRGEIRILK